MSSERFTLREVIKNAASRGLRNSRLDENIIRISIERLAAIFDSFNAQDTDLLPFKDIIDVSIGAGTEQFTWGNSEDANVQRAIPVQIASLQHITSSNDFRPYKIDIFYNRVDFDEQYGNRRRVSSSHLNAVLIEETPEDERELVITFSNAISEDSTLRFVIYKGFSSESLRKGVEPDGTVRQAYLDHSEAMPHGLFNLLSLELAIELQMSFGDGISEYLVQQRNKDKRNFIASRSRFRNKEVLEIPGFPLA